MMPAMEMTFPVNPRTLTSSVRPGDKIEFSVDAPSIDLVDRALNKGSRNSLATSAASSIATSTDRFASR
jgi:Copper binding periplasmic protein CusF